MKRFVRLLSILAVVSALAGCAGQRPVMPAPYTVVISTSAGLNPDRRNRATPAQVRLFELQNSTNFENADFYTLYDKDEQALGADVLSKEQLTVQPGERVTLTRKAKPGARMLGVFVAFKDLENSTWHVVTPLPQAKELGRLGIFNPSFKAAVVNVQIDPRSVTAETTGVEVPVPIPGTGGLPQIDTPGIPSLPSAPSGVSLPDFKLPGLSGNK